MRQVLLYPAIIICCCLSQPAYSQFPHNPSPDYYDTPLKRLLAYYTGSYMFFASQGRIDPDSAMCIATTVNELNPLLPYNTLYDPEASSKASKHIGAGQLEQARALLRTQQGEAQWTTLADLASHYLYKPGGAPSDLDQAKQYIEQLGNETRQRPPLDRWTITTNHLRGALYYQQGNIEESQKYFSRAVDAARQSGNTAEVGRALIDQATHLPFLAPAKEPLLKEALAIFEKQRLRLQQMEALLGLIQLHFRTNIEQVKKEYVQLLKLEDAVGFRHHQMSHNALSYLYVDTGEYLKALTHAKLSIESMEATNEVTLRSVFYGRMGSVHKILDSPEIGLVWNEKALNCCVRNQQTKLFWYNRFFERTGWLLNLHRWNEALRLINETTAEFPPTSLFDQMNVILLTGACYEGLNQFDKAKGYYEKFKAMSSQVPPEHLYSEYATALYSIADFYFDRGSFEDARKYVRYMESSQLQNRPSVIVQSRLALLRFKLDSLDGNYMGAIKNYEEYKITNDSVVSANERKKMAELSFQYESEKKDQDIKLLTQQNDQANFTRNITFGGIAMLLVIVALLYSRYRVKQRSNVQLEEKQIQISQKNTALENLLGEKEWLLKEIHHRVKNNLQMVMSLLSSQAAYLDKDALAAIQDGQHRVYSMSLIHQKLYNTQNVTSIDMSIYLHELVTYLRDSFSTAGRVLFKLTVDPVELDVTQAIPLGLIVNEAITNSLKHAFPGGREGSISLVLTHDDDMLTLTISDDGVGVPDSHQHGKPASFGMKLISGLSRELDGKLRVGTANGTTVSITFKRERLLQSKPEKETVA